MNDLRRSTLTVDWQALLRRLSSGPAEDAWLVVVEGAELGLCHRLRRDAPTVIGRDRDCDLVLPREDVSRYHAEVCFDGEGWTIRDLASRNGVLVGGHKTAGATRLAHGELVAIGGAILRYVWGRDIEGQFHEEMYRLTVRDGLTGLHNRRYLLDFLEREVARARRHARPLSLAMLDLDGFKELNDAHGHLVGDRVLRQLAELLAATVRREQLLARWGGDELCMVLTEQGLGAAFAAMERVRRQVVGYAFALGPEEGQRLRLSISVGVAELGPGEDETALIQAADAALYRAKLAGRDRVEVRPAPSGPPGPL